MTSSSATPAPNLLQEVLEARARVSDEARAGAIARQHAAGKLSARERIAALVDPSSFHEIGALIEPKRDTFDTESLQAPADGVVTGFARIQTRGVCLAAFDYSVLGGSNGRVGGLKLSRLTDHALEHGCPLILLLDGGGHRIQEGLDSSHFAEGSRIFQSLALLSGWVPEDTVQRLPKEPFMPVTWYDKRVPAPDECVLRPVLEKFAAAQPDKVFARFADGSEWTYRQTLEITRRTAAGFQRLGVRQGDKVHSWLPNGPDAIRVWFGLNYLGAVYVPINLSYRGRMLENAMQISGATLLVAHAELTERLVGIDRAKVTELVVIGGPGVAVPGLNHHPAAALEPATVELSPLARDIMPWDLQSIIYTSGTTGPSKGVMSSYLHNFETGTAWDFVNPQDRHLVILPLFHVGGTGAVYSMLVRGASVAIVDAFQTDTFWDVITRNQATVVVLLGGMATLLNKRPPSEHDRRHSLRVAMMIPLLEDAAAFSARFGCEIYTLFNMTEISCPIVSGLNPAPQGTCGQPRAGVDVRIVDENDCEVAPGTAGELIVRTDRPWAMTSGYYGNPEATARSWRNGWFHTGDAFRLDPSGNYFFVDRMKDAIRRRGENISSFEVEAEVSGYVDVQEAAAVAVPSEHGEDEVLVAVVPQPGSDFDPRQLIEYLIPRMTHFMIPRYVRIIAELPKTPTQKVQKHLIRSEGITADTWDREKAGIVIRRQKI